MLRSPLFFMRKLKLLLNKFAIIAPERNMSLGIIIYSNEPIKWEIVNACNHRVTNNVIILLASLDCCKRELSKLVLLLIRRFSITNSSIFSLSFFCRVFPLALFFSYLFSFRVLFLFVLFFFFQQWRMTWLASSDCITDCCQNWSF